jgi:hypothetical protein
MIAADDIVHAAMVIVMAVSDDDVFYARGLLFSAASA